MSVSAIRPTPLQTDPQRVEHEQVPVRRGQPRPATRPHPAHRWMESQSRSPSVRYANNAVSNEGQTQKRLGEFMERAAGPYRAGGKQLVVPPAFRMIGGLGQLDAGAYVARIRAALGPSAYSAVASDVGLVTAGKGTPEQVRRVTQALIDSPAGRQYAASESGIRSLMWDHGVGMDCSGYVHHAFLAARGKSKGLGDPLASALQSPSPKDFRSIDPSVARAGDVVLLRAGDDGAGHKVIVFARHDVPRGTEMHARIARALGDGPAARFHLLEVDSAWGAGGDPHKGGVERRVWAFDQDSKRWAKLQQDARGQWHAFASNKPGPYDHELQGVFRPRAEP